MHAHTRFVMNLSFVLRGDANQISRHHHGYEFKFNHITIYSCDCSARCGIFAAHWLLSIFTSIVISAMYAIAFQCYTCSEPRKTWTWALFFEPDNMIYKFFFHYDTFSYKLINFFSLLHPICTYARGMKFLSCQFIYFFVFFLRIFKNSRTNEWCTES